MSHYQHILLATDFSKQSAEVAEKAYALAQLHHSTLSIIHVMDNIPITDAAYGPIIPFDGDLTEQLFTTAKKQLASIATKFNIAEKNQHMESGSPKLEIVKIAKEKHVDLIIVGSHGRHGLALLLGSTANGVLHHASCDVLAVRLKND